MPVTIKATIKWFEAIKVKYESYHLQGEELWEIAYDDLNEAITIEKVGLDTVKPNSDYKAALMDLRGVLHRKGIYVSRKAGKKITECFRKFLKVSASGTVPVWPLDSLQGILNTEVSSLTELFLGLQYLSQKNSISLPTETSQADSSMNNLNTIVNPVLKTHHSGPVVTYDLPRVLGNISKMYQGEDKKYRGWNDFLDYKFEIYKDICDMSQCPVTKRWVINLDL
ncbi:hypothetical protein GcC1_140019 [Golovinomyces cichoracearum]|uniref:Uncharacterized protein n=1 Tax=Golovinomyces cichoracearum TaxID=62708 RepID=A0A420I0P8_9PEZI|nr:hypothetical protein GcC1_140019 [Golovinomyces cichoracearum]